MNKQQLANKIWASANKMRSKIDANDYKDYILGLIFYKFLSDNEVNYLLKNGWTEDNFTNLVEDHEDENSQLIMAYCKSNIGYFIEYKNLFSTWLRPDSEFSVGDLSVALSSFDRLVDDSYKSVYKDIFKTLQAGLSKLGENPASQTRALKDLIKLIKDIPTDGSQDYDVLGYVYEYLISNFAANAGKKAGEFYTPHEVAILMSEIVAEHHKDKRQIEIYDPTSGSGSLLITIGKSVGRHISDKDRVKYYAQELKENTYNLTRMNLVMRGIQPGNINTRCADSLDEDWPIQKGGSEIGEPLRVDAVVSNPPYSQHWDSTDKEMDARFSEYGVAPNSIYSKVDPQCNMAAEPLEIGDLPEERRIEILKKCIVGLLGYNPKKSVFSKQRHWESIYRIAADYGFVIDGDYSQFKRFVESMQLNYLPAALTHELLDRANTGIYAQNYEDWTSEGFTGRKLQEFEDIKHCAEVFRNIVEDIIPKKK